jgi:uncharacterized protein YkwD
MAALVATLLMGALGSRGTMAQTGYNPAMQPRISVPRGYRYYTPAPAARPMTYAPARPVATYTYPNQGYRSNYVAPAATTTTATTASTAPVVYDQSWFVNWLNGVRAQYGLAAVGYDSNLASWAAANSAEQSRRGLGHFVMGPARRQNSAMGSAASIGAMWMNSPAHRAALLDPTIRWIGLAVYGSYWTFNAY